MTPQNLARRLVKSLPLCVANRLELQTLGDRKVGKGAPGVDDLALVRDRQPGLEILLQRGLDDWRPLEREIVWSPLGGINDRSLQDRARLADPSPAIALEGGAIMQDRERARDVGTVLDEQVDVQAAEPGKDLPVLAFRSPALVEARVTLAAPRSSGATSSTAPQKPSCPIASATLSGMPFRS